MQPHPIRLARAESRTAGDHRTGTVRGTTRRQPWPIMAPPVGRSWLPGWLLVGKQFLLTQRC